MSKARAYLALFCIVALSGTGYYAWATGWIHIPRIPPVNPPPDGQTGQGQTLTLLDQPISSVFQIPFELSSQAGQDNFWHSYRFGSSIPSNAIMAFCMLDGAHDADIAFQLSGTSNMGPGFVGYCIGADTIPFHGSVFVYVPISNGVVMARNPVADSEASYGSLVSVSVVGYITQETSTDHGFYFDFLSSDKIAVSGGTATQWTTLSVAADSKSGSTLIGAYIALDAQAQQQVYFRKDSNSGSGLHWGTDTNDPGEHLIGLIPVSSSGSFQYYTSAGSSVSVYVEGWVFQCPVADGEKIQYGSASESRLNVGSWQPGPSFSSSVRAVFSTEIQSPGQMNTYKVRAGGANNDQIWYRKNSCGIFCILTPLNSGGGFEYWSNVSGSGTYPDGQGLYAGSITITA